MIIQEMANHVGNFISLRSEAAMEESCMTHMDTFAILSTMDRFNSTELDLPGVTNILRQYDFMSQAQYDHILHNCSSFMSTSFMGTHIERLRLFLQQISRHVTMNDFISALRTMGEFQFADVLLLERFGEPVLCMTSSEVPNSPVMNRFYNSVKTLLNSGKFPNKLAAMANLSKYLRNEATTGRNIHVRQDVAVTEGDVRVRQIAMDKLALVTCIRINYYIDRGARIAILSELINEVPEGLEKQSVEIIYCIAMSMTAKKFGDNDAAKNHLDEAKALNAVHSNSIIKFLIWHTQHNLFRTMYVRNPTVENLMESMTACHLGMGCAIPEAEVIRRPWTTTFMVFSALLLVRIGQEFEILPETGPDEKYSKDAEKLVEAAKRESKKWDDRRELMRQLCMARIYENTERNLAIDHCKRARSLAKVGTYSVIEKRNLKRYFDMLQR